jgi:hypothetical protein
VRSCASRTKSGTASTGSIRIRGGRTEAAFCSGCGSPRPTPLRHPRHYPASVESARKRGEVRD